MPRDNASVATLAACTHQRHDEAVHQLRDDRQSHPWLERGVWHLRAACEVCEGALEEGHGPAAMISVQDEWQEMREGLAPDTATQRVLVECRGRQRVKFGAQGLQVAVLMVLHVDSVTE
eukprot:CAMPEP_0197932242 /NCGR_PEP_ID=MMETSP1439-20131203/108280_1 /TAXON_ID=66791 /ORGANISM="Gonyaulax spinifera, Strain CCMP409" /LENGTH=118 /DNA_ID=CAMNT_0043555019 /DNA_START=211 /DNA_END=564 /DNA_ORIENTATION=-